MRFYLPTWLPANPPACQPASLPAHTTQQSTAQSTPLPPYAGPVAAPTDSKRQSVPPEVDAFRLRVRRFPSPPYSFHPLFLVLAHSLTDIISRQTGDKKTSDGRQTRRQLLCVVFLSFASRSWLPPGSLLASLYSDLTAWSACDRAVSRVPGSQESLARGKLIPAHSSPPFLARRCSVPNHLALCQLVHLISLEPALPVLRVSQCALLVAGAATLAPFHSIPPTHTRHFTLEAHDPPTPSPFRL